MSAADSDLDFFCGDFSLFSDDQEEKERKKRETEKDARKNSKKKLQDPNDARNNNDSDLVSAPKGPQDPGDSSAGEPAKTVQETHSNFLVENHVRQWEAEQWEVRMHKLDRNQEKRRQRLAYKQAKKENKDVDEFKNRMKREEFQKLHFCNEARREQAALAVSGGCGDENGDASGGGAVPEWDVTLMLFLLPILPRIWPEPERGSKRDMSRATSLRRIPRGHLGIFAAAATGNTR